MIYRDYAALEFRTIRIAQKLTNFVRSHWAQAQHALGSTTPGWPQPLKQVALYSYEDSLTNDLSMNEGNFRSTQAGTEGDIWPKRSSRYGVGPDACQKFAAVRIGEVNVPTVWEKRDLGERG
jgi:hypothetical protein